jgi:chemotaxis methyl-accepting protein methylase
MTQGQTHSRSHLFALRIWQEDLGDGQAEWRGQVRHVTSGETRYFRKWSALVALLQEVLPSLDDEQDPSERPVLVSGHCQHRLEEPNCP